LRAQPALREGPETGANQCISENDHFRLTV
jgi:hypothetical protein